MFGVSNARDDGRAATGLSGSDLVRNHRCQVCDRTISLRQAAEMTCKRFACKQTILRQQVRQSRKQREAEKQHEKAELLQRLVALRGEQFQSLVLGFRVSIPWRSRGGLPGVPSASR